MAKQFNGKVNLNISGVVNPNIPYWQFNAVLPIYEIINEKESLKEKQYVTKSTQLYGNKNFYENFLKIPADAKSLKATEEFIRLTNEGICSQIIAGVVDSIKRTNYDRLTYDSFLRNNIDKVITINLLSYNANNEIILIYLRDIFEKFFRRNHEFYSIIYDSVNEYNKKTYEKLSDKNFNYKWYESAPNFRLNFSQTNEYNSRLYESLPDNRNYSDYLRLVGVPQEDLIKNAQEEAEKENNTGNKKGTGKTTTNSNITPILIGVGIIVLVIYLKKRRK